jgi:hypothetical protein
MSEGFRNVPGVPDGWELVEVRKIRAGDFSVSRDGKPFEWQISDSDTVWPIIRKIEKPATYRPFADAEEYLPHFDRTLMTTDRGGAVRAIECNDSGVWIGPGSILLKYDQLFRDGFRFFDDGTPFGVKIDE